MSGPLYGNGRRDAAEPAVIAAFQEGGARVARLSANGLPDLLVSFLGVLRLVEVKTGRAKLRASQEAFKRVWSDSPIYVVRTAPQARKWLAIWRERRPTLSSVLRAEHEAAGGGVDAAIEEDQLTGCKCDRCHCGGKLPTEPA